MNSNLAIELGGGSVMLLVVAVFLVTFVVVFGVAYLLLFGKRKTTKTTPSGPATWSTEVSASLPVSPETVDLMTNAVAQVFEKPQLTPQQTAYVQQLSHVRGVFVKMYRGLLIGVGIAGLVASALLLLSHTPSNMLGLPGGIVLLLSLMALLSGLVPSQSITGMSTAVDFRPLLNKINVQVHRAEPLRVSMSEADMNRAVEMIKDGLPISDAARAVYPEFDRLDGFGRQALESALQELARRR
jgi:hypothetical protein